MTYYLMIRDPETTYIRRAVNPSSREELDDLLAELGIDPPSEAGRAQVDAGDVIWGPKPGKPARLERVGRKNFTAPVRQGLLEACKVAEKALVDRTRTPDVTASLYRVRRGREWLEGFVEV